MKNSIEEKRREIFELHQSWLRPDIPLMRQPTPVQKSPDLKEESTKAISQPAVNSTAKNRNWIASLVLIIALILVVSELIFFAFELNLFK